MSAGLVVTADDLGIDARRDAGIFAAHAAGAIGHASLLVAGASAASAASTASRVGLPMGLHLDLTELAPVAPRAEISSLLDARGAKLGKHGLRAAVAAGRVDPRHVAAETRAQLDAFASLVGARARHADGHQHAHAIPAIARAIAPVLADAGVRSVRVPFQRVVAHADGRVARFHRAVSADAEIARGAFAAAGLRSTAAFLGLDGVLDVERTVADAEALGAVASIELMTHPGFPGAGVDAFNESADRERELCAVCALRARLARHPSLRLVTFDDLVREGGLR